MEVICLYRSEQNIPLLDRLSSRHVAELCTKSDFSSLTIHVIADEMIVMNRSFRWSQATPRHSGFVMDSSSFADIPSSLSSSPYLLFSENDANQISAKFFSSRSPSAWLFSGWNWVAKRLSRQTIEQKGPA